MTRAELHKLIEARIPSARCSTGDAPEMPLHHAFLDVTLPLADLPALNALCASIDRKPLFVSVLPYYGLVHRRIRVNP